MQTYDKESIDELLPNRDIDTNVNVQAVRDESIKKHEISLNRKLNSAELTKIKLRERRLSENTEKYGGYEKYSEYREAETKQKIEEAKAMLRSAEATQPAILVNRDQLSSVGTTRVEVAKLLNKLNINLNMQLTKADTMNLLATLLTCNENQLKALSKNNKVPIAVKIIINRLIMDISIGNIDTVEKLWDRVFGKSQAVLEMSQSSSIIPNKPMTREAYILIRESIMGRNDEQ